MKHLKTFENFNDQVNEELFGGKSSAYKRTIEFLEGDSEEAKKVKEIYEKNFKGKSTETNKDRSLLGLMKQITMLGKKWANINKMDEKDYTFKQIQTVLEENFDRKFKGGPDLNVGESKKV